VIPVKLKGGVDLMTAKAEAQMGTLADCLNYEVSTVDGYSRIAGVEPFDGRPAVHRFKLWRLKFVTNGASFVPGDQVSFTAGQSGYVLSVSVSSSQTALYCVFGDWAVEPSLPSVLTNVRTAVGTMMIARDVVSEPRGDQGTLNAALKALAAEQRTNIGTVPGRAGSDIIGMFWLKDRLYAIRDLQRVAFEGGYYTDANEGAYVTWNGQTFQILNVRVTGENQGTMTLSPTPGAGVGATPITAAVLTSLPVTGSLDDGYTTIPYSDGLSVSAGIPPYKWTVLGTESGASITPVSSPDLSAIEFLPQITDAALYRSSPSGWERVDLGREMRFSGGTDALANFTRVLSMEGVVPKTTAFTLPTSGKINTVATTAMNADDGTEAALSGASGDDFVVSGFDFSAIPSGAKILGITAKIKRRSAVGGKAADETVVLAGVTGGSSNKAMAGTWPTTAITSTYGGADDLWGLQSITDATVKAAGFGVRVIAKRDNPAEATSGGIDSISISIDYIEQDKPVYVWNGTSDVVFNLTHVQILNGATQDSNAEGFMTLIGDRNIDKLRLVGVGDQIRDASGGGGSLIATVASRDAPIWMPGQSELDNNRARYVTIKTNFYGQDQFESIYGVCGAGPAFAFDGVRFIRVRTQLPDRDDMPRHVARHGEYLFLGYFAGAVIHSAPSNPLETMAVNGAGAIEIGDRLTNLLALSGDALAIVGQESSFALRGLTPDTFFKSVISAKRGGIEYTAADMGRVVMADGFGLYVADTPESFGGIERNYLSRNVEPWLRERLQATLNSEQAFIRPVTSLAVRGKNQYRLFFWDGYVLTMTMNEPPEFTFQRMFSPSDTEDDSDTPWTVRGVASGLDSAGRERLFVSFFGGIKEGRVFEIDVGSWFDGESIPAWIKTNPIQPQVLPTTSSVGRASSSSREFRMDRLFVSGVGWRFADMAMERGINYLDPSPGKSMPFKIGDKSRDAVIRPLPFRGSVDFPTEGYDVTLKITHTGVDDGPHSLQYIDAYIDDRGDSRGNTRN